MEWEMGSQHNIVNTFILQEINKIPTVYDYESGLRVIRNNGGIVDFFSYNEDVAEVLITFKMHIVQFFKDTFGLEPGKAFFSTIEQRFNSVQDFFSEITNEANDICVSNGNINQEKVFETAKRLFMYLYYLERQELEGVQSLMALEAQRVYKTQRSETQGLNELNQKIEEAIEKYSKRPVELSKKMLDI